jgi:hypothetical protein
MDSSQAAQAKPGHRGHNAGGRPAMKEGLSFFCSDKVLQFRAALITHRSALSTSCLLATIAIRSTMLESGQGKIKSASLQCNLQDRFPDAFKGQ